MEANAERKYSLTEGARWTTTGKFKNTDKDWNITKERKELIKGNRLQEECERAEGDWKMTRSWE